MSTEYQQAKVQVVHGNRRMCEFVSAAGLGVDGVGVVDTWLIEYAPGIQVTYATVEEAMRKLQAEMDRVEHPTKLLSFHVLAIHTLQK